MVAPGQIIDGKYRVGEKLGEGGMGAVYEATELASGSRVALKLILAGNDPTQVARFEREARIAGSMDTIHVARVFGAGVDAAESLPYIAMECLDGVDVQRLVRKLGPLRPALALRITAQACVALSKAHDLGVVHRDIKTANVFLAANERGFVAKLLDFGVAKVRSDPTKEDRTRSLTQTGGLLGSPLYMSPEQAISAKNIDARTDIFSLGVVLYEMLSGLTPHHHHETLGRLIIAICQERAPHIQDVAPWVPPAVAEIVHRALQIEPDDRYPSAAAMLAALGAELPDGWDIDAALVSELREEEKHAIEPRCPSERIVLRGPGARASVSPLDRTADAEPLDRGQSVDRAASSVAIAPSAKSSAFGARALALGAALVVGAALLVTGLRGAPASSPSPAAVTVARPPPAEAPSATDSVASAIAPPPAPPPPLVAASASVAAASSAHPVPPKRRATSSAVAAAASASAPAPRKLGTSDSFE